jgi:hypothetical protein
MPRFQDSFNFNNNLPDDDTRSWRDIPMFGVPDVNGDGRNDIEDFELLVVARALEDHYREVGVEQVAVAVSSEYDAETNTVTVTATDSDGHQAVGIHAYGNSGGGDETIL